MVLPEKQGENSILTKSSVDKQREMWYIVW